MHVYPARALERAMKIKDVITRVMAGKLNWIQGSVIQGISFRLLRRWRGRWDKYGYDGLFDRRMRRPSPKKVPVAEVEKVLRLYREQYFDLNVKHFVEKLQDEHGIGLSYTWVKTALQAAGLSGAMRNEVRIANGGHGDPCRQCCCTSMAVRTAGFRD